MLGGRAQAAARGHALQLAGNGTDVGVSHHLGNRDARKYTLENQLTFFPQASFKTESYSLKSPLIPQFQVRAATFLEGSVKTLLFSCPHKTITQALSRGEESFWVIQRKKVAFPRKESQHKGSRIGLERNHHNLQENTKIQRPGSWCQRSFTGQRP